MHENITDEKKIPPSGSELPETAPPLPAGMAEQILTAVSDPITVIDRDFKIVWMNGPRAAMRRLSLSETRGRYCYKIFNENSQVCGDCPVAETIRTGMPSSRECFADLCDGKGTWTESYTWPIFNDEGEVLYVVHYSRDITERKAAEEALLASKANYQAIFDAANDAIFVHELENGNILDANRKTCEMYGYSLEEIRQSVLIENLSAGYPPYTQEDALRWIKKAAQGEPQIFEWMAKDKLGKLFWVEINLKKAVIGGKNRLLAIVRDIGDRKETEANIKHSVEILQGTLEETVNALASVLEKRDPYTAGHQQRVAQLACAIAREMNLLPKQIEGLRVAAVLHDIGKINIPAEILNRPGQLNDMEMALIKTHSQVGHDIVKKIPFSWPVAQIILQHHERLNGSGYPDGLRGENILLKARILGVADVVEGMVSHRPYRPAHGLPKALEEVQKNQNILYDPRPVAACVRLFKDKGFTFDEL